jgi:hypothetical protein
MGQTSSAEELQAVQCTASDARLVQLFQSLREISHEGIDDDTWQHTINAIKCGARVQLVMLLNGREHTPDDLLHLATSIEYLNMMQNDVVNRSHPDDVLLFMESLGRATAKVGNGLFPLDDSSHPAYRASGKPNGR